MPVHLGGYGIDPKFSRGPFEVTLAQRKVAAIFLQTELSLFASTGKHIRCSSLKNLFGTSVQVPRDWMVTDFIINDHPFVREFCRDDSPYEETDHDPWTAYLAYVERYSSLNSEEPALIRFSKEVQKALKNTWNIHPLQFQTILDWFEVRMVSPKGSHALDLNRFSNLILFDSPSAAQNYVRFVSDPD